MVTHHSHILADEHAQCESTTASLRLPPGITVLGLKQQLIDEHGWPKNHEDWMLIFADTMLDWEKHHQLVSQFAPAGGTTFHSIPRRDRDPDRQVSAKDTDATAEVVAAAGASLFQHAISQ
jgi:hypothetical protein